MRSAAKVENSQNEADTQTLELAKECNPENPKVECGKGYQLGNPKKHDIMIHSVISEHSKYSQEKLRRKEPNEENKQNIQQNNIESQTLVTAKSIKTTPEIYVYPMTFSENLIDFSTNEVPKKTGLQELHPWHLNTSLIKSFTGTFVDLIAVYVGIVCLYEVLEYRMLYHWSFKGLDHVSKLSHLLSSPHSHPQTFTYRKSVPFRPVFEFRA